MPGQNHEKRGFLRHPIHTPLRLQLEREPTPVSVESADLSLGGLCFLWKNRLLKGNTVHISIPVKEKLFEVEARVAYAKPDRKTGRFRVGVAFVNPVSAFKAKLAEESLEILEYRKTISEKLVRE